jgi:glycosyltransferase involved in cell wall biosynthesis
MTGPLVSVVVPAYDAAAYLPATLASALAQTHARHEIIVVDDGSTDDTLGTLAPFRSRIRYVRQENAGPGAARNRGIAMACGDYIALLDADDTWLPETLAAQLDVFARHPESGLVACDGVMVDGDTVVWDHLLRGPLARRIPATGELSGRFYRELIADNTITTPSQTLLARRAVDDAGPIWTGEASIDWEYHLRIAARHPITLHARPLVRYRYHASSASGPLELRRYRWTLRNIPVLRHQLRVCAPEDRAIVGARLRRQTRRQARAAYEYGRSHDRRFARDFLVELVRRVPGDPVLVAYLAALFLPEFVAGKLLRGGRLLGGSREPSPRG